MDWRDTLGRGKDPTATAKRRGEGRSTKDDESSCWEDAMGRQWLVFGANYLANITSEF